MHPRIKQWTVLLLLSTFLFCSTISNAALPVAVPVARAIVSHPYVKERAIKLILAMGGTYAISLLRHKDNKTSVYDMNCVIDGIVDTGPTVQEIEQSVRKNHPYVKVWFAHRSGKYNVYHLDYGPSEKNVYKHTDITCSGPNENDYKDIIIDSQKAAELLTNQAHQGNTEAKNFVKDALKADNPNLTATQIEQLIKGATTTTPPKPVTQPKPPTTTTQPKPPVVTTPAKPANPLKPTNPLLSKGGKQNKANEYVDMIRYKENGDEDPCKWLKALRAKTRDKQEIRKINIALKYYDCDGKNRFDKK